MSNYEETPKPVWDDLKLMARVAGQNQTVGRVKLVVMRDDSEIWVWVQNSDFMVELATLKMITEKIEALQNGG